MEFEFLPHETVLQVLESLQESTPRTSETTNRRRQAGHQRFHDSPDAPRPAPAPWRRPRPLAADTARHEERPRHSRPSTPRREDGFFPQAEVHLPSSQIHTPSSAAPPTRGRFTPTPSSRTQSPSPAPLPPTPQPVEAFRAPPSHRTPTPRRRSTAASPPIVVDSYPPRDPDPPPWQRGSPALLRPPQGPLWLLQDGEEDDQDCMAIAEQLIAETPPPLRTKARRPDRMRMLLPREFDIGPSCVGRVMSSTGSGCGNVVQLADKPRGTKGGGVWHTNPMKDSCAQCVLELRAGLPDVLVLYYVSDNAVNTIDRCRVLTSNHAVSGFHLVTEVKCEKQPPDDPLHRQAVFLRSSHLNRYISVVFPPDRRNVPNTRIAYLTVASAPPGVTPHAAPRSPDPPSLDDPHDGSPLRTPSPRGEAPQHTRRVSSTGPTPPPDGPPRYDSEPPPRGREVPRESESPSPSPSSSSVQRSLHGGSPVAAPDLPTMTKDRVMTMVKSRLQLTNGEQLQRYRQQLLQRLSDSTSSGSPQSVHSGQSDQPPANPLGTPQDQPLNYSHPQDNPPSNDVSIEWLRRQDAEQAQSDTSVHTMYGGPSEPHDPHDVPVVPREASELYRTPVPIRGPSGIPMERNGTPSDTPTARGTPSLPRAHVEAVTDTPVRERGGTPVRSSGLSVDRTAASAFLGTPPQAQADLRRVNDVQLELCRQELLQRVSESSGSPRTNYSPPLGNHHDIGDGSDRTATPSVASVYEDAMSSPHDEMVPHHSVQRRANSTALDVGSQRTTRRNANSPPAMAPLVRPDVHVVGPHNMRRVSDGEPLRPRAATECRVPSEPVQQDHPRPKHCTSSHSTPVSPEMTMDTEDHWAWKTALHARQHDQERYQAEMQERRSPPPDDRRHVPHTTPVGLPRPRRGPSTDPMTETTLVHRVSKEGSDPCRVPREPVQQDHPRPKCNGIHSNPVSPDGDDRWAWKTALHARQHDQERYQAEMQDRVATRHRPSSTNPSRSSSPSASARSSLSMDIGGPPALTGRRRVTNTPHSFLTEEGDWRRHSIGRDDPLQFVNTDERRRSQRGQRDTPSPSMDTWESPPRAHPHLRTTTTVHRVRRVTTTTVGTSPLHSPTPVDTDTATSPSSDTPHTMSRRALRREQRKENKRAMKAAKREQLAQCKPLPPTSQHPTTTTVDPRVAEGVSHHRLIWTRLKPIITEPHIEPDGTERWHKVAFYPNCNFLSLYNVLVMRQYYVFLLTDYATHGTNSTMPPRQRREEALRMLQHLPSNIQYDEQPSIDSCSLVSIRMECSDGTTERKWIVLCYEDPKAVLQRLVRHCDWFRVHCFLDFDDCMYNDLIDDVMALCDTGLVYYTGQVQSHHRLYPFLNPAYHTHPLKEFTMQPYHYAGKRDEKGFYKLSITRHSPVSYCWSRPAEDVYAKWAIPDAVDITVMLHHMNLIDFILQYGAPFDALLVSARTCGHLQDMVPPAIFHELRHRIHIVRSTFFNNGGTDTSSDSTLQMLNLADVNMYASVATTAYGAGEHMRMMDEIGCWTGRATTKIHVFFMQHGDFADIIPAFHEVPVEVAVGADTKVTRCDSSRDSRG